MRADLLHVVTCIANPMRWSTRTSHTRRFLEHMLSFGLGSITLVETEYGDRPHQFADVPGVRHIPTRAKSVAWAKESALNLGIRSLPPEAKYVAWVDADVEFRNPNWAAETVHALQLHPVVQCWSEALDLGPFGEVMVGPKGRQVQKSFASIWVEGGEVLEWWRDDRDYCYPHPGYAWAARVDFLDAIGLLLDFSGLGAADHQMSVGFIGKIEAVCGNLSSDSYTRMVHAWGERAFRESKGHLGVVPGRIEHWYHGDKANRKYHERWEILRKAKFDPVTDLYRNQWGILELSDHKPELVRDVTRYFRERQEDPY